ncbi:DUF6249 domain-containing protein [Brevundimonas vesicularis]|uniref:DUF6249 domain-containing protein n=1 Tax=Brevundimonas vesicularis TaxID=41276 RepID=UPI0038D44D0A
MEILIPLAPFIMVIAIVVIPAWLKSRERKEMQETLRTAIAQGQTLPEELVEKLTRQEIKEPATAAKDIRLGVILLSVSIGIVLLAAAIGMMDPDAFYPVAGAGAIPGMIGVAFVVLSFFNKNKG